LLRTPWSTPGASPARRKKPIATQRAVEVAVEVLARTLPSTLWEVEVITEVGVKGDEWWL
jgi:hypothetical protein